MAKKRSVEKVSELRKQAEKILAKKPQPIRALEPDDIQKLIHELNVHQIELEMQNAELHRIQLELEETRDKYLNLYDFAPTGYFTLDRNSLIVDVNLAGSELLGIEKHILTGKEFTSYISHDSQDVFYLHFREVHKTGTKISCELKMLKADGSLFDVQLISLCIPEKDGNINYCRVAVIDITERKHDEERVLNLNEVLKALRGVNQLITREKDRERLIKQSCELMVETRGVYCAWILLFEEDKKYIAAAVSNSEEMQAFSQALEQGDYPPCVEKILAYKDSLAVCSDIFTEGPPCLPENLYGMGQGLISRLEYGGKLYGVISVYVPSDYTSDPEEQVLFRELAGDIAYALYNIEREEVSKQAEEALRRSEERYRDLIENLPIGMGITSLDGQFLFANKALQRMRGYDSREELMRSSVSERYYDLEDRKRWMALVREKGGVEGFEMRLKRKDGSVFWVSFSSVLQTDISGTQQMIHVIQDITERKRAEELYMTIAQNSPIGVYIFQDGKFCFVNPEFRKLTGYSEAELLEMSPYELVYPEDRQQTRQHAIDMLKGRRNAPYEFRVINREGEVRWAMETITSINYGRRQATLGNFMDITEHREMEELLKENEEKFSSVFYANPNSMLLVSSSDGAVVDVNEAFIERSGFTREECIGNTIQSLSSWVSQEARDNFFQLLNEQKHMRDYEAEMYHKSGQQITVLISVEPITISGKPYIVYSLRDITERKKMEEQLIVTDRLASVGELSAGIAHEMNNPLTGVIGFSDLLLEREDLPEDVREDLKVINREANRTAEVVKNLLTFARKHDTEKKPADINQIIRNVLELRTYEQKVHNINVNASLASDLPEIKVDAFKLQQVFINLVINAEYFMIEAHGKGELDIVTERVGDNIRITFADDGPGITRNILGHIFDPFFTTKEVGKGTGLGLSICHGIIAEHGGEIHAESEPGKGAAFIIEIPVNAK